MERDIRYSQISKVQDPSLRSQETSTLKGFECTQAFFETAIAEGAHFKIPETGIVKNKWEEYVNVTAVHLLNPDTSLRDEGKIFNKSKERVRQTVGKTIRGLWQNVTPNVKTKFPIESFVFAKPQTQETRERISSSRGGESLRIKEQVEAGVTDIKKISENTGISVRKITNLRSLALKTWGIDVPRIRASHKESLQQLKDETDDKKTRELLDKLSDSAILGEIRRKKGTSQFLSVGSLVREIGFHPNNKDIHFFAESLEESGILISRKERVVKGKTQKRLTYYILLSRDKERATKVFKEDQLLQRFLKNPVVLLCGPEDTQLPNSIKLRKKEGYEYVSGIFKKLGRASGVRYSDFFKPDCPTPIFYWRTLYFYPVSQEEELRLFIAKNLNL